MQLTVHTQHTTIVLPNGGAALPDSLLSSLVTHGATALARQADAPAAPAVVRPTDALTPPAAGELWPGQGGYYVCTLPAAFGLPARHLIVAADEQDGLAWGGYDSDCHGAASQTDGRANTAALVADDEDHPAAQYAHQYTADGHNDFHLPSRHDLYMAYLHAPQLFQRTGWYWSSSQCSRLSAWCQDFECGSSGADGKGDEFRARPVRWIHL